VIFNSSLTKEALRKPVTFKKHLDTEKMIELLKEKGIDKYIEDGKLNREGELFMCENMNSIGQ
jgi:asparagine synthetase B (glutamine-hydrolysing)